MALRRRVCAPFVPTALGVIPSTDSDTNKFPSDKHCDSWLGGLGPGTKIAGGNARSGKNKPRANRAAQALRLAPAALRTSQSELGGYYCRLCARIDKPKAVTAAAHKVARLKYGLLTKGEEYTDRRQACHEERFRRRALHNLNRQTQQFGSTLVPTVPAPQAA